MSNWGTNWSGGYRRGDEMTTVRKDWLDERGRKNTELSNINTALTNRLASAYAEIEHLKKQNEKQRSLLKRMTDAINLVLWPSGPLKDR